MPKIILGFRRLYDALGVATNVTGEIHHQIALPEGKNLSVYLGPKPPLGIVSLEGGQYFIPGRDATVFTANSEYKAPAFLEITVRAPREISGQQLELLKGKDQDTRVKVLEQANEDEDSAIHLLDAVSGLIGLRVHRQLVLRQLVQNPFI